MRKVTVEVEDVTISFPKARPFFGTIENSLSSLLRFKATEPEVFTALEGISLKLREGEIVGLIGKNGSGKSTLLRAISGIYRPDYGKIRSRDRISLLAGLGIGFNVHLTGRENVYLYGSILGNSKKTMKSMMDEIINFSELHDFIDNPLRTYSSGMKARLSFSVASAVKSNILLIDEVLGVGDYEFRERSQARIKEMVADAATVFIVSHNFGFLEQTCNRIIMIDQGKIRAIGEPKEVIEIYKAGLNLKEGKKPKTTSVITKEPPKRSMLSGISHGIQRFSLAVLRLFGLGEWAATSFPTPKIEPEDKVKVVEENWGKIIEKVSGTPYVIEVESRNVMKLKNEKSEGKMTLVILTCVWKRPKLTEIVLSHYSKLKEEIKETINLELVAVGSEGEVSKNICESCGFHYYEHENQPMSKKWDYGLKMTQKYNPDAVIIMGSDDIITKEILDFYIGKIKQGFLLVGIKDFFIYESNLKKLAYWRGYGELNDAHRMDETIGLGRCLARPLLDKLNFSVWGGLELDRNLDGAMTNRLRKVGIFPISEANAFLVDLNGQQYKVGHVGYKLEEMGGFAVDIKTKTNMTPFDRYVARDPESVTYVEGETLEVNLPDDTISKIMSLGGTE